MMRPSSRNVLVEAAVELVLDAGYEALTFEALTARSGLSRSGIVYHFAQRDALVTAVCERLAEAWDEEIAGHLTAPFEESEALDRARAYLAAALHPRNPGLFLLRAGPTVRALAKSPWRRVIESWVPAAPTGRRALDEEIARLRTLAEGCYARIALEGEAFDETARDAIESRISPVGG